jgi:hypothetical protein
MGEQADYEIEKILGFGLTLGGVEHPRSKRIRRRSFQSGTGNYRWRTKSGIVSMRLMTTEHLQNAVRLAEEHGSSGKLPQLKEVLAEREGEPHGSYYPE